MGCELTSFKLRQLNRLALIVVLSFSFTSVATITSAEPNPITQFRQDLPQSRSFQSSNQPFSQVTAVSELRDVEPTAWAYEALRSLVERYGCIVILSEPFGEIER